jgi:hypothetical protein
VSGKITGYLARKHDEMDSSGMIHLRAILQSLHFKWANFTGEKQEIADFTYC